MKKILFFCLVLLFACKKDHNSPAITPASGTKNEFTFSTICKVNNVTITKTSTNIPEAKMLFGTEINILYGENVQGPSLSIQGLFPIKGVGVDTLSFLDKIYLSIPKENACSYDSAKTTAVIYTNVNPLFSLLYTQNNVLKITKFGNIGDQIEGTFNFTLFDLPPSTSITPDTLRVSGQFSAKRVF